jgi:hypothetical protein
MFCNYSCHDEFNRVRNISKNQRFSSHKDSQCNFYLQPVQNNKIRINNGGRMNDFLKLKQILIVKES